MRGATDRTQRHVSVSSDHDCCGYSAEELTVVGGRQPTMSSAQVGAAAVDVSAAGWTVGKYMTTFNSSSGDSNINSDGCCGIGRPISNIRATTKLIRIATTDKPIVTENRNSLESINSKFSISSANDDSQLQSQSLLQLPGEQNRLPSELVQQKQKLRQQGRQQHLPNSVSRQSTASSSDGGHTNGDGSPPTQQPPTAMAEAPKSCRTRSLLLSLSCSLSAGSQPVAIRYFSPPSVPNSYRDNDTTVQTDSSGSLQRQHKQELQQQQQTRQPELLVARSAADSGQLVAMMSMAPTTTTTATAMARTATTTATAATEDAQQQQQSRHSNSKSGGGFDEQPDRAKRPPPIMALEKSVEAGELVQVVPAGSGNKPPFMFAGIAASIAGSVFFSLSILCIKLLPDSDGFNEKAKALFFRGLFMMILCGSTIIGTKSTFIIPKDELLINILRACFGTLGVFGTYCSLRYISMGDSTALVFSSPIWTSILSHFILKEPLQVIQLLALPASIFGIVLIAHPTLIVNIDLIIPNQPQLKSPHLLNLSSSFDAAIHHSNGNVQLTPIPATIDEIELQLATVGASNSLNGGAGGSESFDFEHRWPGIAIALFTSLLVSCTYIVLKFRKKTPIQTTTFWLGFTMFAASIAIMSAIGFGTIPPSSLYEWSLLLGNGVCSWIGQTLLQWALLHEEAGILSIVRTLDVAMTFILSALFLEEDIYWTSVLGATIIGLVVASIMLSSWIKSITCFGSHRKQQFSIDNGTGVGSSQKHQSALQSSFSS